MNLAQRIRQDIQQGFWPPAKVLRQTQLAEHYGVSRIPVRDAIQQLLNEGWLSPHGKAGFAVASLSAAQLEDIYLMRQSLEPLLLGLAINHISHQVLGEATDILNQLDDCNDPHLVGLLNWQFHYCIYACADHPTILETINQLQLQCSRYIGYQSISFAHMQQSQQEHRQLLEAIAAGQQEQAKTLLASHIVSAGRALVARLGSS